MIGIYAITDAPPATFPGDATLGVVRNAGLVAFCGPAPEGSVTAEQLWHHEEVIETLMKTCDVLPVRFGTRVEDEHAAAEVLARQQRTLRAALERVRGAVELSVRVVEGDREHERVPVVASGADYMRAKALQVSDAERLASAVHEPLARMARASSRKRGMRPREAMRGAYLVDRAAVGPFADRVGELQRAHPELHVLCTGPWPPYSFVAE